MVKVRTVSRVVFCLAALATVANLGASDTTAPKKQSSPMAGRYLYVVDGGGGLTKLDTVTGRQVLHFDLESRTGQLRIPPASGSGAPDGCLASQAIFDQAASRFYTVAAKQYRAKSDGSKDFEVLAFTVPGLRLAGHWPAGEHINADNEPTITGIAPDGAPNVVSNNAETRAETKLDMTALGLSAEPLENRIMERSGDVVLLDLLSGDTSQGIRLAAAQLKTKTLSRQLPPLSGFIHLTPGGGYIVAKRGNQNAFEVYAVNSGRKVKVVAAPQTSASEKFLAISPNGRMIFNTGSGFQIVNLGMTFPNVPVTGSQAANNCLSFFFANE